MSLRQRPLLRTHVPLFAALAVIHTWPLARYAGSRAVDLGDGILSNWVVATVGRQLLHHPLRVFDVNMYYPYRHALATLDHQLTTGLLTAPLALITDNPLLPGNLFAIASFALAGLFTALLVQDMTGSTSGGLLAGCVYAFSPARIENILRTHVLADCWLPLALLALRHYVREPGWKRMWAATGAYLLLALSSWYGAVIGGVAVAILGAADTLRRPENAWAIARRAIAGAAVSAVMLAAVAWPYYRIPHEFAPDTAWASGATNTPSAGTLERQVDAETIARLAPPLETYLAAAGGSHLPWSRRLSSLSAAVGARFFPGLVAATFGAIAGIVVLRRFGRSRLAWPGLALLALFAAAVAAAASGLRGGPIAVVQSIPWFFALLTASVLLWILPPRAAIDEGHQLSAGARPYLVLGLVGILMSLGDHIGAFGRTLGAGIYPVEVPPFDMLRAVSRWGTLFSLSAAVLAGAGIALVEGRLRSAALRRIIAVLAITLANAELLAAPIQTAHVERLPDVYEWLRKAPPGPVIDFPLHANPIGFFWSLAHRQPLINGAGAVQPALYHRLDARDDLSPDMLAYLRAYFHPRYAVVNMRAYAPAAAKALDEAIAANRDQLTLVAQFGARRIYEIGGPSRGLRVLRSYQPWMLEGKRTIEVRGRIEPGSERGQARLEVWGNGRPLGSADAAALTQTGGALSVALPTERADVLNVEVLADYGRADPDWLLTVTPDRTRLQMNGHVWIGEKGYTLAVLKPGERVPVLRVFNTSWSEEASHALAAYVNALPDGTTVAAATFFDASRALTEDAVRALAGIGATADLRGKLGWAHAIIGVKGAKPGTVPESTGEGAARCQIGDPQTLGVVVDEIGIR